MALLRPFPPPRRYDARWSCVPYAAATRALLQRHLAATGVEVQELSDWRPARSDGENEAGQRPNGAALCAEFADFVRRLQPYLVLASDEVAEAGAAAQQAAPGGAPLAPRVAADRWSLLANISCLQLAFTLHALQAGLECGSLSSIEFDAVTAFGYVASGDRSRFKACELEAATQEAVDCFAASSAMAAAGNEVSGSSGEDGQQSAAAVGFPAFSGCVERLGWRLAAGVACCSSVLNGSR